MASKPRWPWLSCGGRRGWSKVTIELVWDIGVGVSLYSYEAMVWFVTSQVELNLVVNVRGQSKVMIKLVWDISVRSIYIKLIELTRPAFTNGFG